MGLFERRTGSETWRILNTYGYAPYVCFVFGLFFLSNQALSQREPFPFYRKYWKIAFKFNKRLKKKLSNIEQLSICKCIECSLAFFESVLTTVSENELQTWITCLLFACCLPAACLLQRTRQTFDASTEWKPFASCLFELTTVAVPLEI